MRKLVCPTMVTGSFWEVRKRQGGDGGVFVVEPGPPRRTSGIDPPGGRGYEVYPVVDAGGGTWLMAHETALRRMEQAGAQLITWPQLLCELQRDWSRKDTAAQFMKLFIETGGTNGAAVRRRTRPGLSGRHRPDAGRAKTGPRHRVYGIVV
ncbi:hypothetical protein [Streptomyces sp. NPDC102437]|uniref:hypothetical protein n=1 Tax=Streptomyces sp. NPDC102437 TaxID=3366175 RepID=UPI003822B729